jgi:hypothetical protein
MGHPSNIQISDGVSKSIDKSFDLLLHHYMTDLRMSRTEAFNTICETIATEKEKRDKPEMMTWVEYYG